MATNQTVPTDGDVAAFLAAVPDPTRRADAEVLCRLLGEVTGERPVLWGPSIVGFGSHHYRYASGREGDTPIVGFSPRKAQTVVYLLDGFDDRAEILARLGRHTLGKGCLYLPKLADVDLAVLRELLAASVAVVRSWDGTR